MGGSESKRRVVVEDVNGEGVVQVTEAVVRRMKGLPDSPVQKTSNEHSRQKESPPPASEHRVPVGDSERYKNMTKDIEDFYMDKLNDLQKRSAALQEHSNEQFANAVKEVEEKFMKYTSSPVCQDLQAKVLECYQTNPNSILDCSSVVNAFSTCVDRARMMSMMEGAKDTVSQSRSHEIRQAQPVS